MTKKSDYYLYSGGILLIFIVLTFFIFALGKNSTQKNKNSINNNAYSLQRTVDSQLHLQRIISNQFQFSLLLPDSLAYVSSTPEYWFTPQNAVDKPLLSIGFSQPNSDMSSVKNRATPNEFNTAPENSWFFTVYPNKEHVSIANISQLSKWSQEQGLGPVDSASQHFSSNTIDFVSRIQADGVDSHGYYYYATTNKYIFVIGSDDYSDTEMQSFIAGLELHK
jgi:hypothetical protein